jgi:TPR repeat protein
MYRLFPVLLFAATIATGQTSQDVSQWLPDALRGDANAALWLGVSYRDGKGVTQDLTSAAKWFSRSATQGNADAAVALGQMYEDGQGVRRDLVKAAGLYQIACEQRPDHGGAGHGCNDLGLLYLAGHGVAQDKIEAYKFFTLARNDEAVSEVLHALTRDEVTEAERRLHSWRVLHPER